MNADRLREWTFAVVPAEDVQVGDQYANSGPVTEVVFGPATNPPAWSHGTVGDDEVVIRCGECLAMKRKTSDGIVVGRRF